MKKLIGTVVLAAMVAGAAFAEISIGDWGRAMWVISGAYDSTADKTKVVSDVHQSWGWDAPRVGFSFSGTSDNIGFETSIHFNGGDFKVGDTCAAVWVQPIEWLRFTIAGGLDWNRLRGDFCLPLWGWDRIGIVDVNVGQEGWIFPDLLDKNVSLVLTPVEGLTIGGAVGVPTNHVSNVSLDRNTVEDRLGWEEDYSDAGTFANEFGRNSAFAVGYTIEGVGTIKAGIEAKGRDGRENKDGDTKDLIEIDAAFELSGIEGLYVGIGAQIPVGGVYTDGFRDKPVYVNLGVGLYMVENLSIQLRGGVGIGAAYVDAKGKDDLEKDGKVGFVAELAVTYGFGEGFSVFGDFGYADKVWMQKKDGCFTFGVGIDKGFSNGSFGIAFEGCTNSFGRYGTNEDDDGFAWTVPIRIQHWF